MGLTDWLFGATPGQQAGQAVKEVVTSVFDGIDKIIDNFHLAPEDKVKFQLELAKHKLDTLNVVINDIQSAREMQVQTRSLWPGIISSVMVLGFFGGGGYILVHGVGPNTDELSKQIINMFAVQLMAGISAVIGFWLGSSYGSQSKDQLIHNSTPVRKDGGTNG